jgi:hypothetical protein
MVNETRQPNLEAKANNSTELLSDTVGSDLTSSLNRFFKDINFIFFIELFGIYCNPPILVGGNRR